MACCALHEPVLPGQREARRVVVERDVGAHCPPLRRMTRFTFDRDFAVRRLLAQCVVAEKQEHHPGGFHCTPPCW